MPTATCPECSESVHVDAEADKGDTIVCDDCGVELEIVGLDPIELDLVEDDYYDDDDDDDDDY